MARSELDFRRMTVDTECRTKWRGKTGAEKLARRIYCCLGESSW